jgi:molecular chaperone IbpA
MKTIDLTPLYRNSIGFDRLAPMLEGAFRTDSASAGYPPYNIEMVGDNRYAITLAVAGFTEHELDIQVERGVLTVRGEKADDPDRHHYLYQGIATRAFERKFNLAEYVEVAGAKLENGLLNINLVREIPEEMRPKRIEIHSDSAVLDHRDKAEQAA